MGARAFVLGVTVAVVGLCAPPAWAAFPGRDGVLVVATGSGLELVVPATGAARSICADAVLCGHPAEPRVSPSGRAIAFVDAASRRPVVVAADGSCLWCLLGAPLAAVTGSEPGFTASGEAVTLVGNGLWTIGLTGAGARRLATGPVTDAVWSSRGLVAAVRGGWIWVGRPGHGRLRRLARGRSPSFSPDGARLALARSGYVWVVRVRDGAERRLASGGAPAWSPTGLRIAYIGSGGAVEIIAVRGGRPHEVGSVHGAALDWQPLPTAPRGACTPPAGSTVVASNPEAVVFSPPARAPATRSDVFYGCLKALGRNRLLLDGSRDNFQALVTVRLAGRFALLEPEYESQYGPVSQRATLYDLGSGQATHLADVSWDSQQGPTVSGLDSLALDASGFAAWRETARPKGQSIGALSCRAASLCVGGDRAGNIVSSTDPTGGTNAWGITGLPSNESITGVSCPSSSLCVAVGSHLLTATDPTGGANAWASAPIDPSIDVDAISCPSVRLCVAGGGLAAPYGGARILTSTDPTGGAGSWTSAPLASSNGTILALACPSVSLCVATTSTGEIFTSTNPTGGASAWTNTTVDPGGSLLAVSCPSVSLCLAAGSDAADYSNGEILTTTNPAGGASAWRKTTIDRGMTYNPVSLEALSCASRLLCVTGDNFGNILTSTNPTGGASAWTKATVDPGSFITALSCPSVSLCVATDSNYYSGSTGNVLTTTNPTRGANTWTSAAVDIPGCARQSRPCESEQLYAHDDQGTRVVDTAPPGADSSIANVALDHNSHVLTWTHDGAVRQLELR